MFANIRHQDFGSLWHHPKTHVADKPQTNTCTQDRLVTLTVSFKSRSEYTVTALSGTPYFLLNSISATAFCPSPKQTSPCKWDLKASPVQMNKLLEDKVSEKNSRHSPWNHHLPRRFKISSHQKEKNCLHARQLRKKVSFLLLKPEMRKCKQFMKSALLRKRENMEGRMDKRALSAKLGAWILGVRTGVQIVNHSL